MMLWRYPRFFSTGIVENRCLTFKNISFREEFFKEKSFEKTKIEDIYYRKRFLRWNFPYEIVIRYKEKWTEIDFQILPGYPIPVQVSNPIEHLTREYKILCRNEKIAKNICTQVNFELIMAKLRDTNSYDKMKRD